MSLFRKLGAIFLKYLKRMGIMGLFLFKAIVYTFIPPLKLPRIIKQIHFIGFQSMLVIILTGCFTGMVLGFQGYHTLSKFGSDAFLGPLVGLSLIKELGPVFSAFVVTGMAGSAITAEIGIMRISEQIDAMELMGLNPFRYLVVPNLLAGVICLPLLTVLFDVVGIFGGYLIGVKLLGVGAGVYMGELVNHVKMDDIMEGIYKSLSFGIIIIWVSCYKGYYTGVFSGSGYGAEGVSRATINAVVISFVLVLIWDYFMTSLLF